MKDIGEKRRPGVAGTLVLVPSDELPLSSLPFGPKALVDVPFLSVGCDLQKDFWGPQMGPERFLKLGNAILGPTHVQLILAALLLYRFGT